MISTKVMGEMKKPADAKTRVENSNNFETFEP